MKRISFRRIASGLVRLTVYSVVSAAAGLAIWYFLARAVELWRYDPGWVSTAFLVVLMAAGFAVPGMIDRVRGWFTSPDGRPPKEGWGTSLRAVVTAILVPVAIFAVAKSVPSLSRPFFPPPSNEYQLGTEAADAVMRSESSATRVAGIEALGAIRSKDGLAMLTKIVEQQPSVLNDQNAYTALSKAIASHGLDAKTWLLATFQAHPPAAGAGSMLEGGLYERYFQPSFSDLEAEVRRAVADPARQKDYLLKLAAEESQLKSDLAEMEAQETALESGDRTLDFVLDTAANLKLYEDSALAQLAKQVASDATYGVGTRRRAILLIAQFGVAEDYASLLPLLQDSDESVRATALVAMKHLYQKSQALPTETPEK